MAHAIAERAPSHASGTVPRRAARILLVDDEPALAEAYAEILAEHGYEVVAAGNGDAAMSVLWRGNVDAVLSDVNMPGMDGVQLLRAIRQCDLEVPVVLMTGGPTLETAVPAVEYGALRYLVKPVDATTLGRTIAQAVEVRRRVAAEREELVFRGRQGRLAADASLEESLARAMDTVFMAYQPIVDPSGRVFGYETLVRTSEGTLPHPGALFEAAERLGRVKALGRANREAVARSMSGLSPGQLLFVNLHPDELADPALAAPETALARQAGTIVLEITERAALEGIPDVRSRVRALKDVGFRIAVDDLGAGYAGLNSFALVEPEVVKLDMALIRGADREPIKRRLIRSVATVCRDLGVRVVAEGIETPGERDVAIALGCDLLQGFLFGRPGPPPVRGQGRTPCP